MFKRAIKRHTQGNWACPICVNFAINNPTHDVADAIRELNIVGNIPLLTKVTNDMETNDMKTEKGSSSSTANTDNNNNNNAIRHTDAMVTTTSTTATAAATTTMTSTNHDIAMSNSNRPRRTRKIPKNFKRLKI